MEFVLPTEIQNAYGSKAKATTIISTVKRAGFCADVESYTAAAKAAGACGLPLPGQNRKGYWLPPIADPA